MDFTWKTKIKRVKEFIWFMFGGKSWVAQHKVLTLLSSISRCKTILEVFTTYKIRQLLEKL